MATPIGNLADVSFRAVDVLKHVDLIACEDTRHSRTLLNHYGIVKPLTAMHEHNEEQASSRLLERLLEGISIALITDAGTPLISDPGYRLVRIARGAGVRVVPIPGACALVAALSASGLPTDRFIFEGFPPRKPAARKVYFETMREESRTLIFYESSHRMEETLRDIAQVFPPTRRLALARELTKRFETIVLATVADAQNHFASEPDMRRGEFVLMIEGAAATQDNPKGIIEMERVLRLILGECSLKTAVALTSKITGMRRDEVYRTALGWTNTED